MENDYIKGRRLTNAESEAMMFPEDEINSECPRCKKDFHDYEDCDDGYYKRVMSMERCPFCGQKLDWRTK